VKPGQAGAALNHCAASEGFLAEASDNPIVIPLVIVICDGVCIRVLAGPGEAGVGLGLLPLFPAPNAVAAPRASCAPQGAARISESKSRVPPDPDLVLLVVENNIAERQENFGRTTSFRRRRRLSAKYRG